MKYLIALMAKKLKGDRAKLGVSSSLLGLLINSFLLIIKFILGLSLASLALIADAINNSSDFLSSLISLFSFKYSAKPADKNHPFGHARFEYIASSFLATLILALSINIFYQAILSLGSKEQISYTTPALIIMLISIVLKLFAYFFNLELSQHIDSTVLKATAVDSLSDILTSTVILLAFLVQNHFQLKVDAYLGIILSLFIFYSGYTVLRSSYDKLMGQKPDPKLEAQIIEIIQREKHCLSYHDLVIHSYGPGLIFAQVDIEVDYQHSLNFIHEVVDRIERAMFIELKINMSVHLDPIRINDPTIKKYSALLEKVLAKEEERLCFHDLRVKKEKEQIELSFDLVIPDTVKENSDSIADRLISQLQKEQPQINCYITCERNFDSNLRYKKPSSD